MDGRLKDKVIILAGAGGIGDGLARRYAAEGATLVIGDLDHAHAAALAKTLDPSGDRVIATALDGGDDGSVAAIVGLATGRFGRLDGFHANFANVADGHDPRGIDLPLDAFDQVLTVNARGYFLCSRHAIPAMIAGGGGSLVYTSSVEAFIGADVRFAYAMAKGAIQSLMRNVARRYGPDGIRANAIAPGFIGHDKLMAAMGEAGRDSAMARTAIRSRVGQPEDIAAMGAFLLSDDAGYVTGQVMVVDGGMTMRP